MANKKTSNTTKKIKNTSKKISKKTGIPASFVYFLLLLLIILAVLASEFFGFTTIAQTYFPDVYMMVFPPTPTVTVAGSSTTTTAQNNSGQSGDWWTVYFTDPTSVNDPDSQTSEIETALIALIDGAQSTIDMSIFEFNLESIVDPLIAAEDRGVEVRLVTDDEYGIEEDEIEGLDLFPTLEENGVEVIDDDRTGLMHNKYIIFDQRIVWTGSTNITVNGLYRNNNNAIVIVSEALAAVYQIDFDEMWAGDFGARAETQIDQQSVTVFGTPITVYFSPEDKAAGYLADLIAQAEESIYFMAFSFTNEEMGDAMISRYQAGVPVTGIFETRGSETEYSELTKFYCLGMAVRQDGNPRTFHHKVIILDGRYVITGSFNFSDSANESNNENVIIIDHPAMAQLFLQEFERRWDEAAEPDIQDLSCP